MAEKLYRIKLYGFTGADPEAFAKSVAALVGMEREQIMESLKSPPVVLKEGLTKERADTIVEAINILKGLGLAEPMEAGPADEAMARLAEISMLREKSTLSEPSVDIVDFYNKRRTGIIVGGLIVLFIILISWPFLMRSGSVTAVRTQQSSGAAPFKQSVVTKYGISKDRPYWGWSEDELLQEYDYIQSSVKDMKIKLRLQMNDLRRLSSMYPRDEEHLEKRRESVGKTRMRIRAAAQELELIKEAIVNVRRMHSAK